MSWRKRSRRGRKRERPFQRRVRYESTKAALVAGISAGVGSLAGFQSSRWEPSPTVQLAISAVLLMVAAGGTGLVTTYLDVMREKREQRDGTTSGRTEAGEAAESGGGSPQPTSPRPFRLVANPHRVRYGGYDRRRLTARELQQLLSTLNQFVDQLQQATRQLTALAYEMRDSREKLLAVLRGARSDAIGPLHGRLAAAQAGVTDVSGLLLLAVTDVTVYRAQL